MCERFIDRYDTKMADIIMDMLDSITIRMNDAADGLEEILSGCTPSDIGSERRQNLKLIKNNIKEGQTLLAAVGKLLDV